MPFHWSIKLTRSDCSPYMTCLVACGFKQEHGRDYHEAFVLVAHMTTIHALLAVAFATGLYQFNVYNVFLRVAW